MFLWCCGSKIDSIEYGETIPFIPEISKCKVIKVYDGDTITVAAFLKGQKQCYRFSVRLRGIDSPEIKSHNPVEKLAAVNSRDKLSERILNQIIYLEYIGNEKYGRLLAVVMFKGENMNKWMLDNNLAVEYDGGKKALFF